MCECRDDTATTQHDYRLKINAVVRNNALVIGEPELNGFLNPLPGALEEGKLVSKMLSAMAMLPRLALMTLRQPLFRHFFRMITRLFTWPVTEYLMPQCRKIRGMVIGKNVYLSTREISQMSTVPELVFVNCCHLGRTGRCRSVLPLLVQDGCQYRYAVD